MIFQAFCKNRISMLREGVRLGWNLYSVRPSEDRRTPLLAIVDQNLGGFCQNLGHSWQNVSTFQTLAFLKLSSFSFVIGSEQCLLLLRVAMHALLGHRKLVVRGVGGEVVTWMCVCTPEQTSMRKVIFLTAAWLSKSCMPSIGTMQWCRPMRTPRATW